MSSNVEMVEKQGFPPNPGQHNMIKENLHSLHLRGLKPEFSMTTRREND